MSSFLESRRGETDQRLHELRESLGEAARRANDKACVYVTGSFARGEATKHSDLDLFIVGKEEKDERKLSRLDEICIKADLIETTRKFAIPDFSGDGQYLVHYTVDELIKTLGKPEDDVNNTFTARLLLLLESRPLIGEGVYRSAIEDVVSAYWRDFEGHKTNFIPAFLSNDILRLWRTFCINYEARTASDPPEKKAKRWIKNYKLKHSRLLTCYSAILVLLAIHVDKGSVNPDDATGMISLTPIQRLTWLSGKFSKWQNHVDAILSSYERFLRQTDLSEDNLVKNVLDAVKKHEYSVNANELGDNVSRLLMQLGNGNSFFRHLIV